MADSPAYPDANLDTLDDTGISRWQKVVGIIGLVVILWVGNQMFDNFFPSSPGPGDPGPGGHGPSQGEPSPEIEEQPDPGGHGPGSGGPGDPGGPGGHGPGQG